MRYALFLSALLAASTLGAQEAPTAPPADVVVPTTVPANTTVICNQPQQEQCRCDNCDERSTAAADDAEMPADAEPLLTPAHDVRINVVGQGVAPTATASPAQAYALAKRAAIADAYRLIAEKVKGVRVEGQDVIKNMMVQRSTIRTYVDAMIRDANAIETTFKDGLCEVEMEIVLSYSQFSR